MEKYKEPSLVRPIIITTIILIVLSLYICSSLPKPYNSDLLFILIPSSFIFGGIIGGIIYLKQKPSKVKLREIRLLEEQNELLNKNISNKNISISEELSKLAALKDAGQITEEEFKKLKRKLIN